MPPSGQADHFSSNKGAFHKSIVQTNQSMSIYSGSQGQGSHSDHSAQSRIPMTDYFIEWITPKYGLKPEKLFDYHDLDNQYHEVFKKNYSKRNSSRTLKVPKEI